MSRSRFFLTLILILPTLQAIRRSGQERLENLTLLEGPDS